MHMPSSQPPSYHAPRQRRGGRRAEIRDDNDQPADRVAVGTEEEPAALVAIEEHKIAPISQEPKPVPQISRKVPAGSAQKQLNKFWRKFRANRAGRPTIVLPFNPFTETPKPNYGPTLPTVATAQFDEAAASCKAKVERIARECRQLNQKYRDYYFDLAGDDPRVEYARYCLDGFEHDASVKPMSVRRVEDIFDSPSFYKDGVSPGDIRQGMTGDCWFLAAVATITNIPGLLEKICVAQDEEVGVYGFVFYRDGEWISSIVDDQLYLSQEEYHESTSVLKYALGGKHQESVYNETYLKGSDALYFASCEDKNETWLPLLEKAYAKAHGDYSTINGGFTGEAVEDLTGGVTAEIWSQDILSKDKFWKEELLKVNKEFLFAGAIDSITDAEYNGIYSGHAYSVLKAKEVDGHRFVLVRNPWGKSEWKGAWSDGSKEWTPYWIEQLEHRFGDDGSFWMSYKDFLRTFSVLERTRLFDSSWSVASAWVSENVEWENAYSKNCFQINLPEAAKVVIVLQQLDDRYFKGLEGEYLFRLHFRIHRPETSEYFVRSRANCDMWRSVSCEVELEAGLWDIAYKITAVKIDGRKSVEEAVPELSVANRKKFLQIGMSYDLAFAKGRVVIIDGEDEDEDEDDEDSTDKADREGKEKENKEESKKEKKDGDEKPVKVVIEDPTSAPKPEKTSDEDSAPALPSAPEPPPSNVTEPPIPKKEGASSSSVALKKERSEPKEEESEPKEAVETKDKEKDQDKEKEKDDKDEKRKKTTGPISYMLIPITDEKDGDSDSDTDENLWNAVAVVGLRVYSQQKGITVQVVRPKGEAKLLLDPDDKNQKASDISEEEKEAEKKKEEEVEKKFEKEVEKGGKKEGEKKPENKTKEEAEKDAEKESEKCAEKGTEKGTENDTEKEDGKDLKEKEKPIDEKKATEEVSHDKKEEEKEERSEQQKELEGKIGESKSKTAEFEGIPKDSAQKEEDAKETGQGSDQTADLSKSETKDEVKEEVEEGAKDEKIEQLAEEVIKRQTEDETAIGEKDKEPAHA
ncbi:Calpain-11 [Arthrobotrys entomopaga]|nr:Calpain-11 [Arthrobotrys entomopaga]